MAILGSVALATHFTAHELGADNPAVTSPVVSNLRLTAGWLEAMRGVVNSDVPADKPARRVFVVDAYRTPEHNTEVGGSPTSDHPNGLAADFEVEGLTPYQVFTRLQAAQAAGQLPAFDQLIFYVADSHIHVGLGAAKRGEFLLKTTEGSYIALVSSAVRQLRGFV